MAYRTGTGCTLPKVLNPATGSCESPTDNPKNHPGTPCTSTPHPVSIISGNKHFDFVDAKVEGSSPLQFVRHYNSSPAYYYPSMFGTAGRTRNPIGQYWYHNYYYGLTVSATEVKLTRADGQTSSYHPVSGGWQADADVNYRLTELLDGSSVRTGWKVTTPDDTVETYNAIGDLLAITDRNGVSQTLTYSDGTTPTTIAAFPGLPISVTDNFGRSLGFTYNTAGQMVTMADPAGNITRYAYDTTRNLSTVTYPDDTPADLTNNPKKTHLYGEVAYVSATPGLGVSYAHSLTGIIDENGVRYATYQYDANGKAIRTEHAGSVEKYSLEYIADDMATSGNIDPLTRVTDPLGSVRTSHFTTVLGVVKPVGSDQPGGSGCSAASSAITYDANGNVASRTDFNGHRTNYSYDLTRNLETSRTEGLTAAGATTPQTRMITTEWHPSFRLPTKITEPGLETRVC